MEKFLIVGIGNPGREYNKTRHQIGNMVIDAFANKYGLSFKYDAFNADVTSIDINNKRIYLAKPLTYVNLSGEFVVKFMKYHNISLSNLFVIYDDLSILIGKFKIKRNGSSGGHNGIKNIIKMLGSEEIKRLKIGILNQELFKKIPIKDYVLSKFTIDDYNKIVNLYGIFFNIIIDFATINFDQLMNKYNNINN